MKPAMWVVVGLLALVLGFSVYAVVGFAFFARESHSPSPYQARTIPINEVPGREAYKPPRRR